MAREKRNGSTVDKSVLKENVGEDKTVKQDKTVEKDINKKPVSIKTLIVLLVVVLVGFIGVLGVSSVSEPESVDSDSFDLYQDAEHVSFQDIFYFEEPTYAYIYKEDCSYCNNVKDDVEEWYTTYSGDIDIVLVDMADEENITYIEEGGYLGYMGTPTLMLMDDSRTLEEYIGSDQVGEFVNSYEAE